MLWVWTTTVRSWWPPIRCGSRQKRNPGFPTGYTFGLRMEQEQEGKQEAERYWQLYHMHCGNMSGKRCTEKNLDRRDKWFYKEVGEVGSWFREDTEIKRNLWSLIYMIEIWYQQFFENIYSDVTNTDVWYDKHKITWRSAIDLLLQSPQQHLSTHSLDKQTLTEPSEMSTPLFL